MGKSLIIKGADFSANGIPTIETELIYDSITGKTVAAEWDSPSVAAISIPPAVNIQGRTIVKIALVRAGTCVSNIGIVKYNSTTSQYTLLATISVSTFNANTITEVNINETFAANEYLMVGSTSASESSLGTRFAVATGDESTNFGRYTLGINGTFSGPVWTNAVMCKIWALAE